MKIVLIGPTYPFRGGIAHYTTLLCKELRKQHHVKFISFKRQYPKLLFPGESDQDPSNAPLKVNNVEYIIDSMNPLTWASAVRVIKKYHPDKIIFPWWVAFWMPQFWFISTIVKRDSETEIVFICHNVAEHESNFMKKLASKAVLSQADRLITHSLEETHRLRELLGRGVNTVTAFHPTYKDLSNKRYPKEYAKKKLGLIGHILLFFGFVREYKGLGLLLDAMPMIMKERNIRLLIVGEFWKNKKMYLEQIDRLEIHRHVMIIDQYIPNEEIGVYFAAADLVVQPYISASGSGICQLAFGFDRPVIATNVGSLMEIVEDRVNGRIVAPGDAKGLAIAVLESLEPATLDKLSGGAARTKEKFSWKKMAEIVAEARLGLDAGDM